MSTFKPGDLVHHRRSTHHTFIVAEELVSVTPGEPSLYRCINADPDDDRVRSYLATDLHPSGQHAADSVAGIDPDV